MASAYKKRGVWYARFKGPTGAWLATATKLPTKAAAKKAAEDLERKAERQRWGLEPLPQQNGMTVGELITWWLKNHCPEPSRVRAESSLQRNVMRTPLADSSLMGATSQRLEDHFRMLERQGTDGARKLAPGTVNHVRAYLRTAFNKARKAGKWQGNNPVADTEARKVPKRAYLTLSAEEVPVMLAHVSSEWQGFMAVGAYLGLRKGEAAGLRKSDVDLSRELLTVGASYDHDTTKGKHADVLPIPPPLLPYIEACLKTPGPYLFPSADGSMRTEDCDPEKVLRYALGRAGIVDGYDHVCRRCKGQKRKEHTWRYLDRAPRQCPTCGMSLWIHALPRRLRFHDLRHSAATVLLRAGVDAHRVQRIMRHASVTTTTGTYGHLLAEDLRAAVADVWATTAPEPEAEAHPAAIAVGAESRSLVTRLLPDDKLHADTIAACVRNLRESFGNELERATRFELATLGLGNTPNTRLTSCNYETFTYPKGIPLHPL